MTTSSMRNLLRILTLFYYSHLHKPIAPHFLCFFVPQFCGFLQISFSNSIGQAMTVLGCMPRRSRRRSSSSKTRAELPHLLRSTTISRLISNFNLKNISFHLTSFNSYEVTQASYVGSARYSKNPNQISVVVFPFQPLLLASDQFSFNLISSFQFHVRQPKWDPAFSFSVVVRVSTYVDSRRLPYLVRVFYVSSHAVNGILSIVNNLLFEFLRVNLFLVQSCLRTSKTLSLEC